MHLSSQQMKMAAVALAGLWVMGLLAVILISRHRRNAGKTQHANLPLVLYLVATGCAFLIAGGLYYEMRQNPTSSAVSAPDDTRPDDILPDDAPPGDTTSSP